MFNCGKKQCLLILVIKKKFDFFVVGYSPLWIFQLAWTAGWAIEFYRRTTPRSIHESRIASLANLLGRNGRIFEWCWLGHGSNVQYERYACQTGRWYLVADHIYGDKCLKSECKSVNILWLTMSISCFSYRLTWKTFWLRYQSSSWMVSSWQVDGKSPRIRPLAAGWSNF